MDLSLLRRHPDVDGPDLAASDAADRLLLDEAAPLLAETPPASTVVIDDAYGALTVSSGATRVHQDLITGERALANNAARLGVSGFTSMPLDSRLPSGARLVLMRLPRSLDRLDEVAALVAAHADPDVVLVAGGRIKHMTTAMNDVLGTHFGRVDVSRARQKSRVLFAREPRPGDASWPRSERHSAPPVTVVAHGGVFAGTRIDIGTRLLLDVLGDAVPGASSAVDLACGTGVVASSLALTRPGVAVLATDRSAIAVRSARATAEANGVGDRVRVEQADGLETVDDGSQELIVLNPPFHSDAALSTRIARHLFADAGRALAPGGELWCVWNSHLRYRGALERLVGPTRQITRNSKFTVTASVRRGTVG